jgi:hypothetical protein
MLILAQFSDDPAIRDQQIIALRGLCIIVVVVCVLGILLWAIIRSATKRDQPKRDPHAAPTGARRPTPARYDPIPQSFQPIMPAAPPPPLPPSASGPGKFIIYGVDRATKMDTIWHAGADSEANARVKADLEGIAVTRVDREVED